MVAFIGNLVGFLIGLVVAGVALFLSGELLHDRSGGLEHGVVTAVIGVVVWAVLSWVPFVGGILALLGWVWVIKRRYPGGWKDAAITGVVAWAAALVIIQVLGFLGLGGLSAVGIPFV